MVGGEHQITDCRGEHRPYGKCYLPITHGFRINFPKVNRYRYRSALIVELIKLPLPITIPLSLQCPLFASLPLSAVKCGLSHAPDLRGRQVALRLVGRPF